MLQLLSGKRKRRSSAVLRSQGTSFSYGTAQLAESSLDLALWSESLFPPPADLPKSTRFAVLTGRSCDEPIRLPFLYFRAQFFLTFAALTVSISLAAVPPARGAESPKTKTPLKAKEAVGAVQRVKAVLEVSGHLLTKEPKQSDEEARKHPLKAIGNLVYEERLIDLSTRRAQRFYEQAEAEIEVDDQVQQVELREDRRWIRVSAEANAPTMACLEGGLTRQELDLLEIPAGSHLLALLLPQEPVAVGDRWQHENDHLAPLFNLDAVTVNDVHSELKGVAEGEARMELTGQLVGSVQGAVTNLEIKAKYSFHLQHRQITWIALAIRENRSIGLGTPGLHVNARLRMVAEPVAETQPPPLPDVSDAPELETASTAALLEYRPEDRGFVLLHDRHWHVLREEPRLSVLRWVDQGQLVAQCNLLSLPPANAKHELKLEDFQQEIQRALGESAQRIVDARETDLGPEIRALRTVVSGQVSGVPIQWIYYHLTHTASGKRLSCVFTMSAEELERFGGEDLSLAGSILFLEESAESAASVETAATETLPR